MPFSPSGVYTLPNGYAGVDGQPILTSQHNPPLEDIQAALSLTLLRDGRAPMVSNLNMNTFKAINLANGTNSTDAVNLSQLLGLVTLPTSNKLLFPEIDLMVKWGSDVLTTNVSGGASLTFPTAFSFAPTVVVSNGDANQNVSSFTLFAPISITGFSFATTPVISNGSIRVNWIAIGNRT
jgi:Coiled stalk of trimeric autotransporter adhesin